jgi:iron complex outermembrane recepter protein
MDFAVLTKVRSGLMAGAVALAVGVSGAWAQTAPTQTAAVADTSGNELETVVVTSTRLQNAGFDAPTPTQVLNADTLQQVAQPNIFDAVIQLPALQGSTGTTYETGSTSTGLQGLSTLSLRGFSPLRTLTLFDGERIVGSNINQTVDVSLLPQMLIQRVDVVTGGASASWGSDAIAGVVNFITDKKFNGFKADVSYGETTYGDNSTTTAKFAAGTPFAGGNGHFEISGEYMKDDGVMNEGNPQSHVGCGSLDGRTWDTCAGELTQSNVAALAPGAPYSIWAPVVQGVASTLGGLVENGPLAGLAFSPSGSPYQFQYASGGVVSAQALASKALSSYAFTSATDAGGVVGTNGGYCLNSTCISTPSQPGDLTQILQPSTLVSPLTRDTTYARLSYDITPTTEVFATFNFGNSISITEPAGAAGIAEVSIPCNSAYLPAPYATTVSAGGVVTPGLCQTDYAPGSVGLGLNPTGVGSNAGANAASYPFGAMPIGMGLTTGAYQSVQIDRQQRRFVLGGDGAFDLFGKNVTWDSYVEWGGNVSALNIYSMPLKPNIAAASLATINPATGKIQCGIIANQNSAGPVNMTGGPVSVNGLTVQPGQNEPLPGSQTTALTGCVPYDVLTAPGNNSTAALQYIMPLIGPYDNQTQVQEAGGLNFNVKPVTLWAGDISTAFGVDYRLENYHAYADPYGNGSNCQGQGNAGCAPVFSAISTVPYSSAYPYPYAFSPVQVSLGSSAWNAGNYHIGNGQYTVDEIYLETGIPLYKIPGWGSLDADLAGRFEHYNTAGGFYTWKMGLVWETPLSGVRLRALTSADLRAPNLSEAFAPVTTVNSGSTNPFNGAAINFAAVSAGNPALLPETSKTQEIGVVFQPDYIRGLHASVDWYRISLSNIIGATNTTQGIINNCYAGATQYCAQSYITTTTGVNINNAACTVAAGCTVTAVVVPLGNLASATTDGIDMELSYQWNLRSWGVPGSFGIHGLATHVYGFTQCSPSNTPVCTDYAGANGFFSTSTTYSAVGGTIPTWKMVWTEQYGDSWGSVFLSERWFNAGYFSNDALVCASNCPVETQAQANAYPTINYNHMPGALYWDAGATMNVWGSKAEIYAKVNNIANLAPPPSGSDPVGAPQNGGWNGTLYDVVGRMYYLGFRLHL